MAEGLTKKQLKELKKLEKLQSRNLEQKNNAIKWIAISVVCALFLVLFVGVVLVAKNKNAPKTADGSTSIAENGHVRNVGSQGNDATNSAEKAQKSVTLVEYGDLQCPACKAYHPIVKGLISAFPEQLKFVYKNFPLSALHPNAMNAAIASEAVNKQNKYFEFTDILYDHQEEWASLPDPSSKFEEYVKSLGLDLAKYKEDLKDPELPKLIESHRSEGINNGVTGTPTFFLDGNRIDTPSSLEDFKKLISDELSKVDAKSDASPTSAPDKLPLQ